jgi:hypothetical protein
VARHFSMEFYGCEVPAKTTVELDVTFGMEILHVCQVGCPRPRRRHEMPSCAPFARVGCGIVRWDCGGVVSYALPTSGACESGPCACSGPASGDSAFAACRVSAVALMRTSRTGHLKVTRLPTPRVVPWFTAARAAAAADRMRGLKTAALRVQIAFGAKPKDGERACVELHTENEKFALGTLSKGTCDQFSVRVGGLSPPGLLATVVKSQVPIVRVPAAPCAPHTPHLPSHTVVALCVQALCSALACIHSPRGSRHLRVNCRVLCGR